MPTAVRRIAVPLVLAAALAAGASAANAPAPAVASAWKRCGYLPGANKPFGRYEARRVSCRRGRRLLRSVVCRAGVCRAGAFRCREAGRGPLRGSEWYACTGTGRRAVRKLI